MSDEKYVGADTSSQINEKWSVPGTQSDFASTPMGRELQMEPLGFGKALLFPPDRIANMGKLFDHVSYVQCPICRSRMSNSARYCSDCGLCLKPDKSYENSW